jgi:AcrR family transcriptional regulator
MGRRKTYDRDQVLRRAMNLFWTKGYEGAHLQELVEVAGINRFSLYSEFGGKEGLFRQAVQIYIDDLADLGEILAREPLGIENILAVFRAESRERFHHGCFALNTLVQKHVVPDDVFAAISQVIAASERAILRNLKAARDRRELHASFDANALARLVTALNIGLLSYEMHAPGNSARKAVVRSLDQLLHAQARP